MLLDMLTDNPDIGDLDDRLVAMIAAIVEAQGRYTSSRGPSYSSYQALKAMGLDSALVITDAMDENLLLASRNLKNVLVVEPRYADPLSLIHYKKVIVTKGAMAKLEEMWG